MSLEQTIIPKYNGSSSAAAELIRYWRLNKSHTPGRAVFIPGNIAYTKYVAVSPGKYDINPVILVIRSNRKYVLGINVNWLSIIEKRKLMEFLIKMKTHEKSRISRVSIFRSLRKLKFTRKAYRLYFKDELFKPRVYNLTVPDLYNAISRNLLKIDIVKV